MAIKPVLFSTSNVHAILDGRKTQTRRIIDVDSNFEYRGVVTVDEKRNGNHIFIIGPNKWTEIKPKYQPGDILWVRETWADTTNVNSLTDWPGRPHIVTSDLDNDESPWSAIIYKADGDWQWCDDDGFKTERSYWKPSIHMPKEAARIFLKVTDVRVEKLQDISAKDAIAEGIESWVETRLKSQPTRYKVYYQENPKDPAFYTSCPVDSFQTLWQSIYGPESWEQNPYVWVYSFERVERPENFLTV